MHVLITGITGYIGQYLLKHVPAGIKISGTFHKKPPVDALCNSLDGRFFMDLSKPLNEQLHDVKVDAIIHTAAVSNLAFCETNPQIAHRINRQAAKELASWCRQREVQLIYLSTDIVFDGLNAPYQENDLTEPINNYGKTKLAGEKQIINSMENYSFARLALVLGKGMGERKNFMDWFLEQLDSENQIPLYYDEIRTPVFIEDAVNTLWMICLNRLSGIFHICGSESINRLELGRKICGYLNKSDEKLRPTSLKDINYHRPFNVALLNTKLKDLHPNDKLYISDNVERLLF